ncbi:aldehyde dehydrogenase family protein [Mucilaginibacter sp. OK098]|uniref:aldehyde dehydrogenase family protein n=1 Tax=Mucilaginibacter sp. OK098 TaxID=1855297 RepID=UPI0009159731|nr:aldehyde dehydrogenase family protein [Mucilaginibacter sp. OK098]SHM75949.1 aldehyde dehydrogenase (NAD+) [Mucilaginibacter sp. OK098]
MMQTITQVFDAQQKNKYKLRLSSAKDRIKKLNKLKFVIKEHEEEIYAALHADLRKSKFESALTELIFTYSEIDFAIKNLNSWMNPRHAGKSVVNILAKNRIYYEPKGVCLIISPWNYPFQLMMSPLVSAIAAGNCAILKPSEYSSATSSIIAVIVEKAFDKNEIACFEGDESVSKALLKFPFDHIFFTGSTTVGKVIMEAAAQHLSSVTLELGGKSPVIIDETAVIKNAAKKIAWGKLINAGQTCIAPDYVLIHQSKLEEFIKYYKSSATDMFLDEDKRPDYSSYAKIINLRHYDRLMSLIADALQKGADITWGGESVLPDQTIHPTVLTNLAGDSKIMQEEIFGPILPVIPYTDLEAAIEIINGKSNPLAMYIFSESKPNIKHLLKSTSSGGACINDVLIHISNPNLPFGGVNQSGTGSCHGFFGFKTFSHERAVVFQSAINMSSLVYPPYGNKGWVLKMLKKLM